MSCFSVFNNNSRDYKFPYFFITHKVYNLLHLFIYDDYLSKFFIHNFW